MYKGPNCDRKSQFSETLTEPLNPCELWGLRPPPLTIEIYGFHEVFRPQQVLGNPQVKKSLSPPPGEIPEYAAPLLTVPKL